MKPVSIQAFTENQSNQPEEETNQTNSELKSNPRKNIVFGNRKRKLSVITLGAPESSW
jgi:hypothetical protein